VPFEITTAVHPGFKLQIAKAESKSTRQVSWLITPYLPSHQPMADSGCCG